MANVLNKLLEDKKPNIEGFSLKEYMRVIPVLVVYDLSITAPKIDAYLNDAFRQTIGRLPEGSPEVARLIVITTREVECLEALSKKRDLRDVFDGYLSQNHPLLSFYDYLCLRYPGDMMHPETLLSQSIEEQFKETGEVFFGKKATNPEQ